MAAQQPPNIPSMNAAIATMTAEGNNMAQSAQTYNGAQQQLTTELSRVVNFPVVQMQQQLNAIQQSIQDVSARHSAEMFNLQIVIQNGRVQHATGNLSVMQSVERGNNPQVPIGQFIPNFPATPNDVSRMTAADCRSLLTSLNRPVPAGQLPARRLRALVREAVGLTPL